MALGRSFSSEFNHGSVITPNKRRLAIGSCTRTIGRKRVVVSSCVETSPRHSPSPITPPRKYYIRRNPEMSRFESLPHDILVRIVCGVDHDDLQQLFHVSKTIREAAIVAKQTHFAFSTPSSKNSLLKPFSDLEDGSKFDEAPDAPKQLRQYRSRFGSKKLAEISVALFAKMEM